MLVSSASPQQRSAPRIVRLLDQSELRAGSRRKGAQTLAGARSWRQALSTRPQVPEAETSTHLESATAVHRGAGRCKLARSVGASCRLTSQRCTHTCKCSATTASSDSPPAPKCQRQRRARTLSPTPPCIVKAGASLLDQSVTAPCRLTSRKGESTIAVCR